MNAKTLETKILTPQVIAKLIENLPKNNPEYICHVLRDIANFIEEKEKATNPWPTTQNNSTRRSLP